jgi:ParB-like chromosome segregation protein Spo0J
MKKLLIESIKPDERSSNVMSQVYFEKLKANISRTGLYPSLVVRPKPNTKAEYVLLDGHYRLKALSDLGHAEVNCEVWDVSDEDALVLLATLNKLSGEEHPRKRAELIQSMLKCIEKSKLSQLIPETESQIDDMVALLKQKDAELKEMMKRYEEAERSKLPVIINLVFSAEDGEFVKAVLAEYAQDPSKALLTLCQQVSGNDNTSR